MVPEVASTVDINLLLNVARKAFSEVERDNQWYRAVSYGDEGPPTEVSADVVKDVDGIFAQNALRQGVGGASFTANDQLVIFIDPAPLSKKILTSGPSVANNNRF